MAKDQAILSFPESTKMVIQYVKSLKSGLYWFELRRCKDQRTLKQNAYYWGVVLPFVAPLLADAWGESITVDDAHEYFKGEFLMRRIFDRETGELKSSFPMSTADRDTEEFAEYLEKINELVARMFGRNVPEARKFRDEAEIPL